MLIVKAVTLRCGMSWFSFAALRLGGKSNHLPQSCQARKEHNSTNTLSTSGYSALEKSEQNKLLRLTL